MGSTRSAAYVYRWDLDKTYLRTEFDTFGDLVRTAIEPPRLKRTVPGAASLMREIQRTNPSGIHILSGSPEQMRGRLEAKLRHDGIVWDSFTLKPTLEKVLEGNFRFVREQLGYKLGALLTSRAGSAPGTYEILFGDDAEADAYIYSLYADLLAGRVPVSTLLDVLRRAHVARADAEVLVERVLSARREDPVRHAFIHLERVSASLAFTEFGPRVCAFYNYFQPALVLVDVEALGVEAALRVAVELVDEHGFDPDGLYASFEDLVRRGKLGPRVVEAFREQEEAGLGRRFPVVARTLSRIASAPAPKLEALPPVGIDYVSLFERDRTRAADGKRRAKWRGVLR